MVRRWVRNGGSLHDKPQMASSVHERLTNAVAITITVVWVISFLVDLFNSNYDPPASVMPLMLATAGFLFGKNAISGRARDDEMEPTSDAS